MSDTSPTSNIARRLADVRRRIIRLTPNELADAVDDGAIVVDIRPADMRATTGYIPGSVVIDRNVLEWRLDPTSPWHIPHLATPASLVVIVCHEGYASSLAAAALHEIGLTGIGDLDGGIVGWMRAGLPVSEHPAGDFTAPRNHTRS